MRIHAPTRLHTALASVCLTAAACSGGGGSPVYTGQVEILLSDAPLQDLSSFTGTIVEARLVSGNGVLTGNLLSAPARFEFLGLQDTSAILVNSSVPADIYSGVELTFDSDSIEAIGKDGVEIPMIIVNPTLAVDLNDPMVGRGQYHRFIVDLDLRASLLDAIHPLALGFDASGSGDASSAPSLEPIGDLKGIVLSMDELNQKLTVQSFYDDDLNQPARVMLVEVDSGAYLQDLTSSSFIDSSAFFSALIVDSTLLEVHGALDEDGVFHAQRIEVEDHNGGMQADEQVKIEGWITSVDSMGAMQVLIQELEQGSAVADPVLSMLADPHNISVSFDPISVPIFADTSQPTAATSFEVGQPVKIKFSDFVGSPFPAKSIEILGAARFAGAISTLALPGMLTVELSPSDFALLGGRVESAVSPVTVDFSVASIVLDIPSRPTLDETQLFGETELVVVGSMSGPTNAALITAEELRVAPGAFQGRILATDAPSASFEASVSDLARPFGPTVPVANVTIDPACAFHGEAASESEFFALYSALQPGEGLSVSVQGIASGLQNEVVAFVIEVVSH